MARVGFSLVLHSRNDTQPSFRRLGKLEQHTHNDGHEDFTITKAGCVMSRIAGAARGCFGAIGFGILRTRRTGFFFFGIWDSKLEVHVAFNHWAYYFLYFTAALRRAIGCMDRKWRIACLLFAMSCCTIATIGGEWLLGKKIILLSGIGA